MQRLALDTRLDRGGGTTLTQSESTHPPTYTLPRSLLASVGPGKPLNFNEMSFTCSLHDTSAYGPAFSRRSDIQGVVTTTIFDSYSTAVRPFDDLRYDRYFDFIAMVNWRFIVCFVTVRVFLYHFIIFHFLIIFFCVRFLLLFSNVFLLYSAYTIL